MMSRIGTLGILTSLCVTACGHGGGAPRSAASMHGSAEEAPVATSTGTASGAGAAYGQPSAPAAAADEVAKSEAERPGLGTSWGETVASRVSSTSFVRASGDSPDATAAIFYNDEAGVAAMSRGRYVDWSDSVMPIAGGSITVSLVDSSGSALRAARVDGRTIAVGSDGDRYIVRIDNHSPLRVEAVATVDGLDVVDGEDGDPRKRGYVIAPYDTLDIEGFRESQGSVRAFRFGSVSDSYASRRGKDRNVGVVGVAVFRERGADFRWTPHELARRETAEPFPARFAPPPPSSWRAR